MFTFTLNPEDSSCKSDSRKKNRPTTKNKGKSEFSHCSWICSQVLLHSRRGFFVSTFPSCILLLRSLKKKKYIKQEKKKKQPQKKKIHATNDSRYMHYDFARNCYRLFLKLGYTYYIYVSPSIVVVVFWPSFDDDDDDEICFLLLLFFSIFI